MSARLLPTARAPNVRLDGGTRWGRLHGPRALTSAQAAGAFVTFLAVALVAGPESIIGVDVMIALLLSVVLYRIVAPVVLAVATIATLCIGFLCSLVQAGGLIVHQPPRATLPFGGAGRLEPPTTFSLFGLSPDQLVNALLMVVFEGLCLLLIVRGIEWWREERALHASRSGQPDGARKLTVVAVRVLIWLVTTAGSFAWSGSIPQALVVAAVLGLSLAGVVDSTLFTIAGVAQIVCCMVLLAIERSGLLAQWQDAVSFLAAHGVTTFEPLCSTIGIYAGILLIAGILGHPPRRATQETDLMEPRTRPVIPGGAKE